MNSAEVAEQFVTLFDSHYLPLGLCLYRSLEEQREPFHLWIVAMDDACADALHRIGLDHATVVKLEDVETAPLRAIKASRSVGEYCWTLTPFVPGYVLDRMPEARRVTYLDADLFFFGPPSLLIEELVASRKDVLITEHAFAPEYAENIRFGRFCVQFVTFRNTAGGRRVLGWWQERCLEWCYAREEDGKFGDQKYLDRWPTLFSSEVHVLSRADRTLAPWNVHHQSREAAPVSPVFYHFHSLRIVSSRRVVLFYRYYVGRKNRWIYRQYVKALRGAVKTMRALGIPVVGRPLYGGQDARTFLRVLLKGQANWAII
jgi:hypothetical protein